MGLDAEILLAMSEGKGGVGRRVILHLIAGFKVGRDYAEKCESRSGLMVPIPAFFAGQGTSNPFSSTNNHHVTSQR